MTPKDMPQSLLSTTRPVVARPRLRIECGHIRTSIYECPTCDRQAARRYIGRHRKHYSHRTCGEWSHTSLTTGETVCLSCWRPYR